MKIVHIITGLSTGGAERALYNLLQGGLSDKFDSHVVSLSDIGTIGPQIEALGVPVTTLNMPVGRPTLAGIIKLHQVIKGLKPDLIQGWMYHGNLVATLASFFCGGKVALLWNIRQSLYEIKQEKWLTRWVIQASKFFSRMPDVLLYNSQVSRRQHEEFGFSHQNGQVIPNGINSQQFRFSGAARVRTREALSIPEKAIVIGHVARFHPMKDHANFLQAAKAVAVNYPDAHFMLSGRNVTYDNLELKRYIPSELGSRFHLLGERRDIAYLMSGMDILCSSSWGEAFPNVLGEAMAASVPCVATDVGDSAFIVGDCGVVVEPKNGAALAVGIESLLSISEKERRKLGALSRRRIEDNFTLGVIVNRYVALYQTYPSEKETI